MMKMDVMIRRAFVVIDRELRREFPTDFHKRCAYSAAAVAAIIRDQGAVAAVRVGDVLGFVVSANGQRAGLQGYHGGAGDFSDLSHVWVETADRTLDLNFHYFSVGGSFRAAAMPAVNWPKAQALPVYAQYKVRSEATHFNFGDPDHAARLERFTDRCRARLRSLVGNPKPPFWCLEDEASVAAAARGGDLWATSALRYQQMAGDQRILPL